MLRETRPASLGLTTNAQQKKIYLNILVLVTTQHNKMNNNNNNKSLSCC